MAGKFQQSFEEFGSDEIEPRPLDQLDDQKVAGIKQPDNLTSARDARKRLEEYWEKKALDDELRQIDDWDDPDD